jgi:uncharacterized protein YjbJ (UPF0337 family)
MALVGESVMNWDQIEDKWYLFKSELPKNWGRLTDEDITRINGRREELASRLQERYGFGRVEAQREIKAWVRSKKVVLELEEAD